MKKQLKDRWWELLGSVAIGAACGALATTNKYKLISTIVNFISSVFSAATSGTGVQEAIIIGIITFIIQEAMKSSQSFSKFNFRKVGAKTSKTVRNMKKRDISKLIDTLISAIRYYFKNNKTLYKKCFGTFSKFTLAQWGAIFGIGVYSKAPR